MSKQKVVEERMTPLLAAFKQREVDKITQAHNNKKKKIVASKVRMWKNGDLHGTTSHGHAYVTSECQCIYIHITGANEKYGIHYF